MSRALAAFPLDRLVDGFGATGSQPVLSPHAVRCRVELRPRPSTERHCAGAGQVDGEAA
ncbi:hypothetical protein [Paractinoplanes atraurantiacus]|uniref:Uncharacterized protein n=1 Tax=Paractinoplanes atraurantiacus TaxID=1036182 RepID=A0A285J0I9_9ACTN|nr:hypothetical protein [Actinoplanes atraurantiacus]SNY53593.1 hypothetical protein SAMN05421748_11480 [Actinoplanes atraurantiacus]